MPLRPIMVVRLDQNENASELARRLELPPDVIADVQATLRPGQKRKTHPAFPEVPGSTPDYNRIPSEDTDACRPLLVVICGPSNSFEKLLREAIRHVTTICPGKTKRVVFATTEWKSRPWRKHAEELNRLGIDVQPILVSI